MIRKLLATDDNTATLILRLVLGIVFFAHGAQKMFGWFGGWGYSATMNVFIGMMHIPAPLAFLRRARTNSGLAHADRSVRDRRQHGRSDSDRAQHLRILHELERRPERRGIRVSLAGDRHGFVPNDPGGRRVLARSRPYCRSNLSCAV